MFENIGSKIKMMAQVCCWVIIAACAVTGLIIMFSESFFGGLLIIVLGALLGWTGSFMMYGFGDLVESAAVLRDAELNRQHQNGQPQPAPVIPSRPQSGFSLSSIAAGLSTGAGWVCKCGKRNSNSAPVCSDCGASRKDGAVAQAAPAAAAPVQSSVPKAGWRCKKCGKQNTSTAMYCSDCGSDR